MKKMRDLKGMTILTLQEGEQLGRVRSLLVDPAAGQVVALVLDKRTPSGEAQVVATANVHSVGKAAITVQDRGSLVPLARIPRFQALARENITVRGKMVVTETGQKMGRIGEMLIDAGSFKIQAILLKGFLGRQRRIPSEQIRTIGPDVVVVQEDMPRPASLRPTGPVPAPPPPSPEETLQESFSPEPEPHEMPIAAGPEISGSTEPAMPAVSTFDEAPVLESVPEPVEDISAAVVESEAVEETVIPDAEPLSPEPTEQAVEDTSPEEGSDNPWHRWVKRLRREVPEPEDF